MVNFLREDVKDEETDEIIEKAPKVYEPGGSLETLRPIVLGFLDRYNETFPAKQMRLVLYDDALEH
jgi:dynein heavy chain